jgi:NAD(P)H-quinone oxidoreductase subunit 4
MVGDMTPRELVIGLSLLVPTLVIGFWPRVAIDFYQASTTALSNQLASQTVALVGGAFPLG